MPQPSNFEHSSESNRPSLMQDAAAAVGRVLLDDTMTSGDRTSSSTRLRDGASGVGGVGDLGGRSGSGSHDQAQRMAPHGELDCNTQELYRSLGGGLLGAMRKLELKNLDLDAKEPSEPSQNNEVSRTPSWMTNQNPWVRSEEHGGLVPKHERNQPPAQTFKPWS